MKDKKVILYSIGSFTMGGAERQLLMLARELREHGHDIHIFVVESEGQMRGDFEGAGIKVHSGLYNSRGPKPVRMLKLLRAQISLISLVQRLRPDVVHGFLPLTNFMASLAAFLNRVPVIITSRRALGTHQDKYPVWKFVDRIANRMSHVVTANSYAVANDIVRRDHIAPGRIQVIYNGIAFEENIDARPEVRSELGLAADEIAMISIANLIPYKGHLDMIEAMAALAGRSAKLKLYFVGEDRGIKGGLLRRIDELHLGERIVLLGQRQDIPRLLSGMDIGIMASHEEGFSNALLEMLHAGLPVVATRVGGNPEALEGMPGCALAEPRDPADLASAIEAVISTADSDDQRAERLASLKGKYSPDAMRDAYLKLYRGGSECNQ